MLDEILAELLYPNRDVPREAIEAADANRAEITPILLDLIRDAAADPEPLLDDEYSGHVMAMYLLAQFRERAALAPILELITHDDPDVLESLGDVVTQDLPSILASVAHNDLASIRTVIEDDSVDEWVRGAAVTSLTTMVACTGAPREEIVAYYRELLTDEEALDTQDGAVLSALANAAMDLAPRELETEIAAALDQDPDLYVDQQDLRDALRNGSDLSRYHLIDDTAKAISWWSAFAPLGRSRDDGLPPAREVTPGPKVGRNEPCPCGSGKKFKKCCGG